MPDEPAQQIGVIPGTQTPQEPATSTPAEPAVPSSPADQPTSPPPDQPIQPTDVPEPTSPPPTPTSEPPEGGPPALPPDESVIPPVIPATPPTPAHSKAKIVGTILVFLILLIGIPVGVFLVQRVQEIRERAFEEVDCDPYGGFNRYASQCDCGRMQPYGEMVSVAVCNDGTTFPLGPTGVQCETGECPPPEPPPPDCTNPDGNEGDRIRGDPYCIEGEGCPSDPSVGIGRVLVCQDSQWVETTPECTPECPAPGDITWSQCSVTDGPEPNLPCGSCSVTSVGAGTMAFSCELDCGGSASNCPGGSAGTYSIAHRWERCNNRGTGACTSSSSDYVESGDLGGPGPWTIDGQSTVNGSGTFPNPGCGRVQVDVQMSAEGTDVAAGVYDTGKDCVEPTPAPTPPPPPPGEEEPPPTTAECKNIKAYDANFTQLSATQLAQLKPGDSVRFAVSGTTSSGSFDQARFRVNDGAWQQTTTKNSFGEFFIVFTVPSGVTTFKVEAEVHHADLNQWF